MSLSANEVVSAKRSVILMIYANKRRVLYVTTVKQCMALYSDIVCIQVIFFGAYCKLPSPHYLLFSELHDTLQQDRTLSHNKTTATADVKQPLPTSFLAEEREFHSGNTAYLCSENHCIAPNGHITRSILFFLNI